MNKKYMILCVAGQSNAVGYDESPVAADYLDQFDRERLWQLGLYGEDNLNIIPLGVCAQSYQDMRPWSNPQNPVPDLGTKGIHLPLGNALLQDIPEDYDILVIPCAYGGCGFTIGELGPYEKEGLRPAPGPWRWGVESNYYQAMRDRIAYVLDQNPENQFLGMVWIQGEFDKDNAAGQIEGFDRMTEDFFDYFGTYYPGRVYRGAWDRDVWYNVETAAYWYSQGECVRIWDHYRTWNPATYVEIPRETDSNEVNGTGLTAAIRAFHYGNNAYVDMVAPRTAAAIGKRLV